MDKISKSFCTFLLCAFLQSPGMPAIASGGALAEGIADYNQQDYRAAIAKLTAADHKNALAHYYLALSYQAVGNLAGAEKEYSWVSQNANDKDLKQKASQGLEGLAVARANRALVVSKPITDESAGATNTAHMPKPAARPLVDSRGRPVSNDPSQWFKVDWRPGCPRH